jgi:hypothetical protein
MSPDNETRPWRLSTTPISEVGWRQFSPEVPHYIERLWPSLMSIPPNHVRDYEGAVGPERTLDSGEQILEFEDMVQ